MFPWYQLIPNLLFFRKTRSHLKQKYLDKKRFWGSTSRYLSNELSTSPIKPWAFIRVKNEITTIQASLESILPAIHKGVIGFHRCTDGTKEYILDFCKAHPSFIPFEYPYHVVTASDPQYQRMHKIPYENTIAAYYNAVLQHIPQNEWLIKIDCDQIYIPEILKYSFTLPQSTSRVVSYSRLNLIQTNRSYKVLNYVRPHDHWLIYNHKLAFYNCSLIENGRYTSYEQLGLVNHSLITTECPCYHFPFAKNSRKFDGDLTKLQDLESFCKQMPRHFDPQYFNQTYLDQITQQIK